MLLGLDEVGLVIGAVEKVYAVGLVNGAVGLILGAVENVHVVELAMNAVGVVHEVERWLRIESAADVLVAAAALHETRVAVRCAREVLGFDAVGLVVRAVEKVHAVKLVVGAVGLVSAGERCLRVESAAAVEVVMATRGGAGVAVARAAELLGRDAQWVGAAVVRYRLTCWALSRLVVVAGARLADVALVCEWTLCRLWVCWEWSSHGVVVCRVVHHAGCLLFSKGTLPQGVARVVVVVVRKFGVNSGSRFIWKIEPGCRFSWEMWQNQRWEREPRG